VIRDRWRVALWLLLLWRAPCFGAAAQPLPVVVYDLVDKFPTAEARTETLLINFGAPEARPLLIDGWTIRKGTRAARSTWGIGSESSLRFFVFDPADLDVRFRCRPFTFKDAPEQRITVVVNGRTIDQITLGRMAARYQFTIPRAALVAGENRMVFRYAYSQAPSVLNPDTGDSRPLAVAWEWLQFGSARQVARPSVSADGDAALVVPAGSELDYFVKVAPGTVMTVDDVVPLGSDAAHRPELRLQIQTSDSPARQIPIPRRAKTTPRVIPLPVSTEQIARIAIQVPSGGRPPSDGSGWRLVRPALRAAKPGNEAGGSTLAGGAVPDRPNVIIYLIDTLRADHLSCYGYPQPTSPDIDAFARDAVLFASAFAQSSHTKPCVTSIFTGLLPQVHGMERKEHQLPDAVVTLAEVLQQAGYETAGFTTNAQVGPDVGFGQGFDVYELVMSKDSPSVPASAKELNTRVFAKLAERHTARPFFLYVHTVDPHSPYAPPPAFRERFASDVPATVDGRMKGRHKKLSAADRDYLVPLYNAEVAANDAAFGELMQRLKDDGLYDSSLIVLTADHGEEFYDHGSWEHGGTLYQEVLHIPLIMKLPNQEGAGRTVSEIVQQVDLLPTMAAVAGGRMPAGAEGQSLLPSALGESDRESPIAVAYRVTPDRMLVSAVSGHMKLIHNMYDHLPEVELYDLEHDPTEMHNLAADQPLMTGYLRAQLNRPLGTATEPIQAHLNQATRERLRNLGY